MRIQYFCVPRVRIHYFFGNLIISGSATLELAASYLKVRHYQIQTKLSKIEPDAGAAYKKKGKRAQKKESNFRFNARL